VSHIIIHLLFFPFFFIPSHHLITSCIHIISTEKFLENGSVEGGRASAAATRRGVAAAAGIYNSDVDDSDDESESDESDEEDKSDSDDSDDHDATTTIMPTKTKGSTLKKAPSAAAAAGGTKSEKSASKGELQVLIDHFEKASIRADGHMGYDFTVKYPYFWFRYTYNMCNYVQIEVLLPTTHHDDFKCNVSKDGMSVYVNTAIPSSLIDPRIWQQRYTITDAGLADHVLYQNGVAASSFVRDQIDDAAVNPFMAIKLPFQCQQELHDPYNYDPNRAGNGTYFNYYPHPSYPRRPHPGPTATHNELNAYIEFLLNNYHRVCIASITLKSTEVPRAGRGVTLQADPINW
jgi:hypothetical protein